MLNKVKVSTIPLQNGECAVEIVITIGTEQPKKVKQESTIYAETLEALAGMKVRILYMPSLMKKR